MLLKQLKAFVEYYVYVIVRFVNEDGKKSAPSEVEGPRIMKTPAGGRSSVLNYSCVYKQLLDQNSFVYLCSLNS